MTKVFFGSSRRGDYNILSLEKIDSISNIIESCGFKVIPVHKIDGKEISKENQQDKVLMHDTEYKKLIEADFGIFEISNPAITLGAQICDMIHMGKPILCLYKEDLYNILPRYILGKESSSYVKGQIIIQDYKNLKDISDIVKEFAKNYLEIADAI